MLKENPEVIENLGELLAKREIDEKSKTATSNPLTLKRFIPISVHLPYF
jgi:hypothetical protein